MKVYRDFVRASLQYLSRADEDALSIHNDLTCGCWVYFDAESTGVATGILGKWYAVGNEYSYVLYKTSDNILTFAVSTDGVNIVSVNDSGENYAESQWFYVVGRFTPSTELALFVNGSWYINTTDIPATIFNSSEDFEIGRYNRSNYLDGRVSQAFVSAYSIPDRFICSMFSHAKALYMRWGLYQNACASSSSSTSSSSSSSTTITSSSSSFSVSSSSSSFSVSSSSSSVSGSSSSSSETYSSSTSTSSSTSSSTSCSSSSSTHSSSSSTTSSSSSSESYSSSTSSTTSSSTSCTSTTTSSSSSYAP